MNKSICIKILICALFMIVLSTSFCLSTTYALGDIFSQGKSFLEEGNDVDETINTTALKSTSDYIYNTLLAIGIMVAVVVAMVLGIQFMVASADEKAKVKEALIPFLVGCIAVFGAFTIWKIVVNMGNDAESSINGYSSAQATTEAAQGVIDGSVKVEQLSNEQIKDLYSSQYIGDDLRSKTTKDPRAGNNATVKTLEEAINSLSEYKKKIYYEAKSRGLLKDDGINLK